MAESTFMVHGFSVMQVRLEPTAITGTGSSAYPILTLGLKCQLLPTGNPPTSYTLLRLGGRLFTGNDNTALAIFEMGPLCEESSPQPYERLINVEIPLSLAQIKHIEEVRAGKDPYFTISLAGLVALRQEGRFERLEAMSLAASIPRSHWIDKVLNVWNVSSLRLLEIAFPQPIRTELADAQARLARAEQFYRTGDYPHVLTELRSAFAAVAECYGATLADKNTFDKILVNTHPKMREKLRDSFAYFCTVLNLGPHEPTPTPEVPIPVSCHDARFGLVVAHAIFEYFASETWPGL